MTHRIRVGLFGTAVAVLTILAPLGARQSPPAVAPRALPNYDVRAGRATAGPSPGAAAELQTPLQASGVRRARVHPHTGGLRVLNDPGLSVPRNASAAVMRNELASIADRLGLEPSDFSSLSLVRDYVGRSNGVRHVVYSQHFDDIPVFDAVLAAHIDRDGRVLRVSSSAGPGAGRSSAVLIPAAEAARLAAANVRPDLPFAAVPEGGAGGPAQGARFARGPFPRDVAARLSWLPVSGALRLAWRVEIEPGGEAQFYDVLVDATTGEVLLRRNRVLYAQGSGRVIQSGEMELLDPRRPDESPAGADACLPAVNHQTRSLTVPFRDPATVLLDSGRLAGNNVHVFHGAGGTEAAAGTFDGTQWSFDFPFNSAGAAATTLFFALNFAHDFFYDLGFDEAAGNFQEHNFGRGGTGGDSIHAIARAAGRNNATFQAEPDGSHPIISMFLWDGAGCWSQDVDGDGSMDLDGDFDMDIVLHEFHHGVSHRLNTSFTGTEADAIGEGGSDFFAYSINGDTTLAEYAYPAGLRTINGKTYGDWSCLFGLFCEPHANGEIFANVLWDVRERFRADGVRGGDGAAINESHQLYVDGLALSPPAPTMLDMRDSMLLADTVRNPGSPHSLNFCRLWESFARRGMGTSARDTADHGSNVVTGDFSVPDGCNPPPAPPTVTMRVAAANATESGPASGAFTVTRSEAGSAPLTVYLTIGGSARNGTDYTTIAASVTIPPGAASVSVEVVPIDDTLLESNETVTLTLRSGVGYVPGSPSSGTVTIVSDDVAPDFTVSALTVPQTGAAGGSLLVTETTRNQGTGASTTSSVTSFVLSADTAVDATDSPLGTRTVPALAVQGSSTATTPLTLPSPITPGSYRIIAKADGPGTIAETNEQNNLRSSLIRIGPDLTVTSLTAPPAAAAGGTILVSDTTANGGADAAAASETRVFLSTNASLDSADKPLQARPIDPLAPGAASAGSIMVTIPVGTPTGTYYLVAKADAAGSVPEATETNNTRHSLIRVGPDLQVTSLSAPLRGAPGGVIAISDTTRNAGAGAAGSSHTAFYLSAEYSLDAADALLTPVRRIDPLPGGASSSAVTTVTLPIVAPGRWYIVARADDARAVGETIESNNTRYTSLALGPDLDVTTVASPSTVTAGVPFAITDTVKNIGMGTAAASETRIYLSSDYVLDSSDILLGSRAVGGLADNVSSTGTVSVSVPATVSGKVYLIAATDGAGAVAESSETNNTLSKLITVNAQ